MRETRNTIQRTLVLNNVQGRCDHPTADEVFAAVSADQPQISRGTVYRNLHYLAENGKIRRVELPGTADRFDWRTEPHCHVQCLGCGRVDDVDVGEIREMDALAACITDVHGYRIDSHKITFRGLCPACRQQTEHLTKNNREVKQ